MKTLTALVAALSLIAFTAVAFAGNTHCTHVGADCIAAPSTNASNMTKQDFLP